MLTVADDLSTIALAAGEPLLLDVQFRDADGTVPPASSRAFVLSFYRPDRTTVQVIAGVMLTDESGDFFRFVREGTFSEELLGQTLTVELAERMRNGRYVVTKGTINVASSAAGVLSLGTASIGRVLTRITVRDAAKLGDPPIFSQTRMRYNADGTPPLPVFSTKPSLGHDGTPQVGEQITLNPGVHNGTSTTQQFLLAGTPINGATGLTYVPIASDGGKALSAAVTAKGPGGEGTEITAAVIVAPAAAIASMFKIATGGSSTPEQYLLHDGPTTGSPNPDVLQYDGANFVALTAGRFGLDLGNVIATTTGKKVGWVPAAKGGSGLVGWRDDSNGLQTKLVNWINAVGGVDCVYFQCGLNDMNKDTLPPLLASVDTWFPVWQSVISQIRTKTNLPNLPFFIGLSQDRQPTAQLAVLRQTEMKVIRDIPNCYMGTVTNDLVTYDGTHQTKESQTISAIRAGQTVGRFARGLTPIRGPISGAVERIDTTTADVTVIHRGGTDFTPTTGITGYSAYSSDKTFLGAVPGARTAATKVRLTIPASTAFVGYTIYEQQGTVADSSNIIDNAAVPLPMEPTIDYLAVPAAGGTPTPTPTPRTAKLMMDETKRPAGYNSVPNNTPVTNFQVGLVDTAGVATGWIAKFDQVAGFNFAGKTTGGANTGAVPDVVLQTSLYNQSTSTTTTTIAGLNPAKTYAIRVLGSRDVTDGRGVRFTAAGQAAQDLVVAGNTQNILTLGNGALVPNANGEIVFTWTPIGSTFAYFNYLEVTQNA